MKHKCPKCGKYVPHKYHEAHIRFHEKKGKEEKREKITKEDLGQNI